MAVSMGPLAKCFTVEIIKKFKRRVHAQHSFWKSYIYRTIEN